MTQSLTATQSNKRPYRSKEQWRQLIEEYETSDLSIDGFCTQKGIKYMTFYKWRKRLQQNEGALNTTPSFIELANTTNSSFTQEPIWNIELELGSGTILRLRRA